MKKLFILKLAIVLHLCFAHETILVASASSLKAVLENIIKQFEEETGVRVLVSWDASGNLYAKIRAGAPYHIFISANELYVKNLVNEGLVMYSEVIAEGRLAVVSKKPLECESLKKEFFKSKKIAIANPKYAPYGMAAVSFIKNMGLYEELKGRFVFASSVYHALGMVVSGSADIGIVSFHLLDGLRVYGCEVDSNKHLPIVYSLAILKDGKAFLFAEFLKRREIKDLLTKYGFEVSE